MASWFYMQFGQRFGPVDGPSLRVLAKTGQLRTTDQVWTEGQPTWIAAGDVPDLFAKNLGRPPQVRAALDLQGPTEMDSLDALALARSQDETRRYVPRAARSHNPTSSNMLIVGTIVGVAIACVGGGAFWLGSWKQSRSPGGNALPSNALSLAHKESTVPATPPSNSTDPARSPCRANTN